jgi:hypothetical protein
LKLTEKRGRPARKCRRSLKIDDDQQVMGTVIKRQIRKIWKSVNRG